MDEEQRIYTEQGVEEYVRYQLEHENEPFSPGPAFPFVKVGALGCLRRGSKSIPGGLSKERGRCTGLAWGQSHCGKKPPCPLRQCSPAPGN